jgi:hypothetical protein
MSDKLKLYVWEGVLIDYSSGIVCALARNEEEAWRKVKETDEMAHDILKSNHEYPEEFDVPVAFVVWGGG